MKARNTKELGQVISQARKAKGYTQKQLGEKSVVKQTAISVMESGAEGVRLGTLFKVLAALNLEIVFVAKKKSTWTPEDSFE
jgi:HTH-type transcriptional regulator/antitoxin HipB